MTPLAASKVSIFQLVYIAELDRVANPEDRFSYATADFILKSQ